MNKAVLISIQRKWCELIVNGKKTVEVRKSRPKIETPFKCYIYCSQNGISIYGDGKSYVTDYSKLLEKGAKKGFEAASGFFKWNGKVIGEFVCNEIEELKRNTIFNAPVLYSQSCLTRDEYFAYIGNKTAYIWYISDLKIYDKPKELCEFRKPCIYPKMPYCPTCPVGYEYISETEEEFYVCDGECNTEWVCQNYLKKAPQSWCYVEESDDNV